MFKEPANQFAQASLRASVSAKATRTSPSRRAKENVNYCRFGTEGKRYPKSDQECEDDEDPFTDLSGFIVDDEAELSNDTDGQESAGDTLRKTRRNRQDAMVLRHRGERQKPLQVKSQRPRSVALDAETTSLTSAFQTLDLSTAPKFDFRPSASSVMPSPVKSVQTSSLDDGPAHYERELFTPELSGPFSAPDEGSAFVTPPTSPSKTRLKSPSKASRQIPYSPHRQSLDSFWSSEAVNDWNDQYSPRKTPHTSRRGIQKFLDFSDDDMNVDERCSSPSPTPKYKARSPTRSPSKRNPSPSKLQREADRVATEKRKTFDYVKHQLASKLLAELDEKICHNKLSIATAQSGGVKIIWSKTLTKTAGRANWRKTNVHPDAPKVTTFANIELAEKIVDSPERLVNTLAHEFCHLANYEVSSELADAHGKSWRNWVEKTLQLLRSHEIPLYRNVEITAKHNYKIDYRYVWVCVGTNGVDLLTFSSEGCGMEYGRHSKSINPERERCARCKGLLIQVKPVPRIRKGLLDRARKTSPKKKKSALQEVLEDACEVDVTRSTTAEEETTRDLDVLHLIDIGSRTAQKSVIVDLTESSDFEENSGNLFPVMTGQDGLEKKVLGPSSGNMNKSLLPTKARIIDVVDLTDE